MNIKKIIREEMDDFDWIRDMPTIDLSHGKWIIEVGDKFNATEALEVQNFLYSIGYVWSLELTIEEMVGTTPKYYFDSGNQTFDAYDSYNNFLDNKIENGSYTKYMWDSIKPYYNINQFVNENIIFESSNKKFINDFIFDFGMLITMGFSQITKMGVNQESTDELISMMKRLREPLINGKKYSEIIDNMNFLYNNPKILSAFIGQIRELLIYIEPRVINCVKDGDVKNNWLMKIEKFKERYKTIVS